MSGKNLFSDDPVENIADDQLDRVTYIDHVAGVLTRVRGQGTSSTVVAVIGAWGSGKSTILKIVQTKLPKNWLVARFDPWGYGDVDAIMYGFFGELMAALPKDKRGRDIRKKIGKYVELSSPLGKIASLAGIDGSSILQTAGRIIGGDNSTSAAMRSADEALRNLSDPILMVIDDLDRLEPDELLLVFKLIRSLGRLPNIYYLLCYDEKTLLDVIQRTDLAFEDSRRAQEYLEKMVQVRLDLPPLRESQAGELFEQTLDEVLEQTGTPMTNTSRARILNAYQTTLRFRLQTPRAIRRFFAQVDAFASTVRDDIDFCDFLIVTWLRTFEPSVYKMIQGHKGALTGGDIYERLFPRSHAEAIEYWTNVVTNAGIPATDLKRTLDLLGQLFIPIRSAVQNTDYEAWFYDDIGDRFGIGHVDYFDRYFAFAVTSDDIPDTMVRTALLADVRNPDEDSSVAVARLQLRLVDDSSRAGRKVTAAVAGDPAMAAPAMRLICKAATELHRDAGTSDGWEITSLASSTLSKVPPEQLADLLSELTIDTDVLDFLGNILARLTGMRVRAKREDVELLAWSVAAEREVRGLLEERILALTEVDGLISDTAANLIWHWRFIDAESCRAYCRTLIDRTDLLTVLAQLTPRNHTEDGRSWVAPLVQESLEAFIGLDRLGDYDDYADADDIRDWDNARLPDSPEARMNRAKASLKAALTQGQPTQEPGTTPVALPPRI